MIKKLRTRFIRIAMASVAVVLLLLTAILNTANYIANDHDLTRTLTLIAGTEILSSKRFHRRALIFPVSLA